MRLPDDCGTTLVGSDQERQNRAAEGPVVVSHGPGVAMLPSVELAVEEGTAVSVIRQSRQVGVDARDEAACAIGGAAGFRRPRLVLLFPRHLVPRQPFCRGR